MKDLQRRLSELPAGLEPLYRRMVECIPQRYCEQAAQYFRVVQSAASPLTPLAFSFIDEDLKAALRPKGGTFGYEEFRRRYVLVGKRLKSRCAGLVEISLGGEFRVAGAKIQDTSAWYNHRVQFLHLTVKEFLASKEMRSWLASTPSGNIHVRILTCCLRQLQVTSYCSYTEKRKRRLYLEASLLKEDFRSPGILHLIFVHALRAEKASNKSQLIYLEALDKLIESSAVAKFGVDYPEYKLRHWTDFRNLDTLEPDD